MDPRRQRPLEGLSFDDVWRKCTKQPKQGNSRTKVAQLTSFLQHSGQRGAHGERSAMKLSERFDMELERHFWKQPWLGAPGTAERWVASEATLRRVWPCLWA